MNNPKTLVICLDGATFDLIDPFMRKGLLPNITSLVRRGVRSLLQTVHPPLTAPAWASFITGMNPGKHGVFDFFNVKNADLNVVTSRSLRSETLWQKLNRHAVPQVIMDIPLTYPPENINGIIISGMMRPEAAASPSQILAELNKNTPLGYSLIQEKIVTDSPKSSLQILLDDFHQKEEAALYLLKNKPWEFFMVLFTITDQASHRFYRTHALLLEKVYLEVDAAIGKFMQIAGSSVNIIIMSDHGFGPCEKMVNLNNYFIEKGFIQFPTRGKIKHFLFRHNLTPKTMYSLAAKLKLTRFFDKKSLDQRKKIAKKLKLLDYTDLDWDKTLCYSKGSFGQIHLNEKAFAHWNVTYEDACVRVIKALEELRDGSGNPLVTKILRKDQMYHGPYSNDGADLFVMMKEMSYIAYSQFSSSNQLITESAYTNEWEGTHRMDGIFIASGPNFKRGISLPTKNIVDVPATLLHLFGLSHEAQEMDGKVMTDSLSRSIVQKEGSAISHGALNLHSNLHSSMTASGTAAAKKDVSEKEKILNVLDGIKI